MSSLSWTSTKNPKNSPVWLHSTLLFFWSEKRERERLKKPKPPALLPQDPCLLLLALLSVTWSLLSKVQAHAWYPHPMLHFVTWTWLAPAFTLAVFFQGHLPQLTARVLDHEDLCSGERGRDSEWWGAGPEKDRGRGY
jgi:hypothetical protein